MPGDYPGFACSSVRAAASGVRLFWLVKLNALPPEREWIAEEK
jgi:hypothetical protein